MAKKTKGQDDTVSNTATTINILLIVGALVITSGIIWYALKGPAQTVQREVLPKAQRDNSGSCNIHGQDPRCLSRLQRRSPRFWRNFPAICGCMTRLRAQKQSRLLPRRTWRGVLDVPGHRAGRTGYV